MSYHIRADWFDENQYPRETTPRRWAFEFLLRNPRYQEDYNELVAPWRGILEHRRPEDAFLYDPPRLPEESRDEWAKRAIANGANGLRCWSKKKRVLPQVALGCPREVFGSIY